MNIDRHRLSHTIDSLSPRDLVQRGSLKWSQTHPDTGAPLLGAGVAEHDLGVPECISDAIARRVSDGTLGYLAPQWIDGMTEAFTGFCQRRYGWQFDPQCVHASPDVLSIFRVLIEQVSEPGDAIAVPTPAYWVFRVIPGQLGRRLIDVPSRREGGKWVLDIDAIAAAVDAGAKVVVLCNPWNPVGRALTPAEMHAFAEATVARGAWVFSDEIHAPLTLPGHRHVPFASLSEDYARLTVTATAASKAFSIPGLTCAQAITTHPEAARVMAEPLAALPGIGTLGVAAAEAGYRDADDWLDFAAAYIAETLQEVRALIPTDSGIVMDEPEATYISLWDAREAAQRRGYDSPYTRALDAGVMGNDGAGVGRGYEQFLRLNFGTSRRVAIEIATRVIAALS
ncbi:MAG: aminotransferase class I/II-fold pyridoxal phosphate-dependent enzyme [Actinomycetaceae bacterium]|nr:aminotransferase class I/II-fold pyridoxal phosphate-dependent enzyme [Actinomycetaceae bacterium]